MKYMGSKSRIKKYIVPIIQDIINKNQIKLYIEPMVGGGNIIDSIQCDIKIGNDISTPLISFWQHLQETDGLDLPNEITREHYNDVKQNQNTGKYPIWYVGAVGFLSSFNGKYFEGGYAKPTIDKSNGRLRNYYDECKRNVLKQLPNIKDVIFTNKDYFDMKEVKNTLIYCDIPYQNTTRYESCINFDYNKFWNWVREFSKLNIVVISELQAPNDFVCIWEQEVLRSLNSKNKNKATEKLFVHKSTYEKYFKNKLTDK